MIWQSLDRGLPGGTIAHGYSKLLLRLAQKLERVAGGRFTDFCNSFWPTKFDGDGHSFITLPLPLVVLLLIVVLRDR